MSRGVILAIRKLILSFFTFSIIAFSINAQDEKTKHEMENMHVSIQASQYKSGKFIEKEEIKGKEYIFGKSSSYNKEGKANAGILLQPHAEYVIKSKLPGGTYNVTVFYHIDKDKAPENPKISVGMDLQKVQELEVKDKLIDRVKTSFKVNFLRGKQHTVKLWFPSAGVMVREINISRAILPKKDSDKK